MKFTILGQACLRIDSGSDAIVIDPWIIGSCYWRSWWHFPPARPDLVDPQAVSAIYLTHEHPDHLHFPSLRRFPRDVRILVPRFPVDRMAAFLRGRGFTRVEEMPHGGEARVGSLRLASYQAGTDDSIVRSHAPAQAYPFCYSAEDPRDLTLLTREHYLELFATSVRVIQPRWAIPFASNICTCTPRAANRTSTSSRRTRWWRPAGAGRGRPPC